jgi:hypothetical protein
MARDLTDEEIRERELSVARDIVAYAIYGGRVERDGDEWVIKLLERAESGSDASQC